MLNIVFHENAKIPEGLQKAFQRGGHTLYQWKQGEAWLDIFDRVNPDLVLLDSEGVSRRSIQLIKDQKQEGVALFLTDNFHLAGLDDSIQIPENIVVNLNKYPVAYYFGRYDERVFSNNISGKLKIFSLDENQEDREYVGVPNYLGYIDRESLIKMLALNSNNIILDYSGEAKEVDDILYVATALGCMVLTDNKNFPEHGLENETYIDRASEILRSSGFEEEAKDILNAKQ